MDAAAEVAGQVEAFVAQLTESRLVGGAGLSECCREGVAVRDRA